ncbi:MAG: hypothetical protein GY799_33165 [Desulfobulbaceae bacterium]|nr:hypothetical protein [Desulfobulbaceae bacterium]
MKGYVEIEASRVIEAVNNYEAKVAAEDQSYAAAIIRLKNTKRKGFFRFGSEWEACHTALELPRFAYVRENHPLIYSALVREWEGGVNTAPIRALGLEGVNTTVTCNQDLALFVMEYA